MKKLLVIVAGLCITPLVLAQNAPPVQEITKQIIKSAQGYANAISCPGVVITPKEIAALTPYKTLDDRMDAKYAILWDGDIGCAGGSGTTGTNISIVTVSIGDSFVVDPHLSSPIIQFESPVRMVSRIVGNTRDTLILEGKEYADKDPNCCPSITVRFTLRVDEKGYWKLVEKKLLPAKK
jgi:hypothetical protein